MKKEYIIPEVEVINFQSEELMAGNVDGSILSPEIGVVPRGILEMP